MTVHADLRQPLHSVAGKSAFGFDDVTVTDISDKLAALSLQGPTSCAV